MIDKLVSEIEKALENDLYFVALNTAMILPDVCGKAEYPTLGTETRYKQWLDTFMFNKERKYNTPTPDLNSKMLYDLRCSLLHSGNPNVNKKFVDKFTLKIHKDNGIYTDGASATEHIDGTFETSYTVDVRGLCFHLCTFAADYYETNKCKFNFINYNLFDADEYMAKLKIKTDN